MRVSRAQAEENRRKVIEAAGRLFREHGFDGIGLNDLMGAAGLTQGGFYKQFRSKDDLAVEACNRVLTDSAEGLSDMVDNGGDDPLATVITRYLSRPHRDQIGTGCIFPSLGADAARRNPDLIRSFEAGIRSYIAVLDRAGQASPTRRPQTESVVMLSTMVGALLLSRLVEDEVLSGRILDAAVNSLLGCDSGADAEAP
ncbi:TetR/AcrR family transcriptional regulator [Paraburkholderia sp. J12]|uniref:TetR/AcrR family transcriptional regulator n=1 Tax=Paraburkholderia sp. J12 TaxID=2805432 RepID=UPI002ABDCE2C|nr:TetR/AcrR family transcriptional regulator [Paraburkholderia sp. J12]